MSPAHDVVVVGGGGAGLRAAIAVTEANPRLSVAIVSKVYPMRSHTVSAEGGAAAVIGSDDCFDEHAYDTVSGGSRPSRHGPSSCAPEGAGESIRSLRMPISRPATAWRWHGGPARR